MKTLVLVLLSVSLLIPSIAQTAIVEGVDRPGEVPLKPPPPIEVDRPLTYVFIDFDDMVAPCLFIQQNPLRNEYQALGVTFSGPGPADGAAVLDQCGGFGVNGHSAPNFLATNCNSQMANGGLPWGPETLTFTDPIVSCSALVGSNSGQGQPLSMDAYDVNNVLVDTDTVILAPNMQLISVAGQGIKTVVVGNVQPCVWVLDDLGFDTQITPVEDRTWGTIKALYR
jgi:hypothetical protein